ncbi:uncharacterized protein B0T23DRAFT_118318 [Neurospora hispaniola]|uniref:Uncharacterized protein n=1 Tax=Neurospora hispaniola TaxID=588809 RepID=A0AAJ0IA82_9PEZI|nr:hypothetical protein B0T23DRAFT_118318 [Neurospora hispaniola]
MKKRKVVAEEKQKHAPDKSDKSCRRDFPKEKLQERVGTAGEEGIVDTRRPRSTEVEQPQQLQTRLEESGASKFGKGDLGWKTSERFTVLEYINTSDAFCIPGFPVVPCFLLSTYAFHFLIKDLIHFTHDFQLQSNQSEPSKQFKIRISEERSPGPSVHGFQRR